MRSFEADQLIGLHKLSDRDGSGMVPELYALIQDRENTRLGWSNVVLFPAWEARMPGEEPAKPLQIPAKGGTVLPFPTKVAAHFAGRAQGE
ncbi:hypothetical protein [Oryzifoliimicrobium ureilyticus]|uniref:hypothetical protein n=1 Tax=Oryzifoliimicrobium ureilyticus TaxID=3113724 RepID=UPI00307646D8